MACFRLIFQKLLLFSYFHEGNTNGQSPHKCFFFSLNCTLDLSFFYGTAT